MTQKHYPDMKKATKLAEKTIAFWDSLGETILDRAAAIVVLTDFFESQGIKMRSMKVEQE